MLSQFLLGAVASICNIAVHSIFMTAVVRVGRRASACIRADSSVSLSGIMVAVIVSLMMAHTCEILLWSVVYKMIDAVPPDVQIVYFAFVNYTTLGYGDVIPVERWRLLGPMTAMNGILLFGWSTAIIFEVLLRTLTQMETLPASGE
ncbi:MAG: potassium channel family protein [Pseudorhodoplanes sp.]|jgi:hypothetical protein|nr:potassium channel family protein [Pseudorhodoplanes sp.]